MTDTPNTPETEAATTPAATGDTPPDRLSINQRSPFFQQDLLERGIGIRFNDKVRHDVVDVPAGAQRREAPLVVAELGEVGDEPPPFGTDGLPGRCCGGRHAGALRR